MSAPDPGFEVEWATPARRALERLPEKVAAAAVEFAYGTLVENPHRVGRPLGFSLDGTHSAHRGDYRVLYRIEEDRHVVVVLTIAHRSDVYRRG